MKENEIREVLLDAARKADNEAKNMSLDRDAPMYRIEELKGYARGIRDAYYILVDHIKQENG